MTGEKIYEYDLDITGLTDYGVTLPAILSGQVRVPPQGARIDVRVCRSRHGPAERARDRR
jgi:hypothetical protein